MGPDGLAIYCYTQSCTYDHAWNDFTLLARGLVLDHHNQRVVATPFPKFFNAFEREQTIPDLPFDVFDKIDGSLIILFHRDGWRACTKGAWDTTQARAAMALMKNLDWLSPYATYLLEYVAPENRIVIGYPEPKLYLLSGYWEDGSEFDRETVRAVSNTIGWDIAPHRHFESFSDIIGHAKTLPVTQEGFVVRFDNGHRLKIKGDEYCRIHSMISGVTPLNLWAMLLNGDDLTAVRRQLPEEFWADFDQIEDLLHSKYAEIFKSVKTVADKVTDWTDKEVGLALNRFPPEIRRLIFPYRKDFAKLREAIYRDIRPDGNRLDGYAPSFSMNRVAEES
jgi:RNA ligase